MSRSAAIDDYAKAIYALEAETGTGVGTVELATRLGVSRGGASRMLRRLGERGLVTYAPYSKVRLTAAGRRHALEVIRHHRLLELFLAESVGLPWERVHEEAEVLEHALSEGLEAAIAKRLGDPRVDPHGDPIPTPALELDELDAVPLADLEPERRAVVARVSDADSQVLRRLREAGVRLGGAIELRRPPVAGEGSVEALLDERTVILDGAVAAAIWVRRE